MGHQPAIAVIISSVCKMSDKTERQPKLSASPLMVNNINAPPMTKR
jgi:hypothetical protein